METEPSCSSRGLKTDIKWCYGNICFIIYAHGYNSKFVIGFAKGNNFCGFIFAIDDKPFPERGLLFKERICSCRSKFVLLRVGPY